MSDRVFGVRVLVGVRSRSARCGSVCVQSVRLHGPGTRPHRGGDTGMLRGLLSSKVYRSVVLYCTERVPRHRPHTGYGSPTETPASSGPRGSGVSLRYVPVRRWGPRAAVKAL